MKEIKEKSNKKIQVIIEDDNKITTYFCEGDIYISQPIIDTYNKIGKYFGFTSTEVTITEQDKKEKVNSIKCKSCGKDTQYRDVSQW